LERSSWLTSDADPDPCAGNAVTRAAADAAPAASAGVPAESWLAGLTAMSNVP
jgi:hypothetical protein